MKNFGSIYFYSLKGNLIFLNFEAFENSEQNKN